MQIEYALEAVQQGSAVLALRSDTHAVMCAVKRNTGGDLGSFQRKVYKIDDHLGIGVAGLTSDARVLCNYMRTESMRSKLMFDKPLPVSRIVDALGEKAQKNTQGYGGRPYGVGMLVIGYDGTGPHVFDAMPTGSNYEYVAQSIGSRSQSARTYLERKMVEYKACGLDDLIVHGLKALKDTLQQEKKLGVDNVTVAYVGKDQEFVIVEGDALEPWLSRIDQTVPETVVEEMQVDEAAGDAMEE